jgi:energy-coupling factor transport system permease protein
VRPTAAAALLFALAAAALLARHTLSVALLAVVLLAVCLRAPVRRRWVYLIGTLGSAAVLFVVTPFVEQLAGPTLWSGPSLPVLGTLDVTTTELSGALFNALRLASVGLAFAAYALLLDHDRLVQAAGAARRSVLAVALATRLVPALERDAAGLVETMRGRGVEPRGVRGRARLLSPLLAGSLERSLRLAEAMEARGFGRPGATRLPQPPWRGRDRAALAIAAVLVAVGALWL